MAESRWKPVRFYSPIRHLIRGWPVAVKKELGAILTRLQKGEVIGMPDIRSMPSVASGAAEVRISDRTGSYRAFHLVHTRHGILVFHAFTKKAQRTPRREIDVGRTRLQQFLFDLEDEDAPN